ncbi:MAG TPA: helix-turn-helix transcriptional regulator [Elusimicrobiota bacterium]|jgi:hypothetical protein|nr:helix-turn-helix transcriptional regulator [Elusimicrobiota bacterium]
MAAEQKKLLTWNDERAEALIAWIVRGAELGVSFLTPKGKHSDSAAVGEALKRAAACRCCVPGRCNGCGGVVEEARKVYAIPVCYKCLPPPPPIPVAPWPPAKTPDPAPDPQAGEANPLRAMREAAGLSQAEAAARVGMTRGAWANAEKASKATSAMIERARKGLGERGGHETR